MLGAVAITYFFAAALVMAIACSGPDVRAKFASAYLMISWGFTNFISTSRAAEVALLDFSPYDMTAVMGFWFVMLKWPARWTAVVLAALSVQVIFQLQYAFDDPGSRRIVASHLVNEAMYVVQLAAVCAPTISQLWRRRAARRSRLDRLKNLPREIPAPYEGWVPPLDVAEK